MEIWIIYLTETLHYGNLDEQEFKKQSGCVSISTGNQNMLNDL